MRSSCKAVNFGIVYGISGFLARAGYRRDAQRGRASLSKPTSTPIRALKIYGGHQADRQGAGLRYDPVRPPPRCPS